MKNTHVLNFLFCIFQALAKKFNRDHCVLPLLQKYLRAPMPPSSWLESQFVVEPCIACEYLGYLVVGSFSFGQLKILRRQDHVSDNYPRLQIGVL